jgi:hypothetical protein
MSYAYFDPYGRRVARLPLYGLGAAASASATPLLSSFSMKQLLEIPYEKLLPLAISKAQTPEAQNQLSYMGQFYSAVANTALQDAGGGLDAEALFFAASPILKEMVGAMADAVSGVLGATAGVLSVASSALGPIGPLIFLALKVGFDIQNTLHQQYTEKARKDCTLVYSAPSKGSGYAGAIMPCDLLATKATPLGKLVSSTSLADALLLMELPYQGHYTEAQLLMRVCRLAIQRSKDVVGSDGGAALWPVYLDLIWSQFVPNTWRPGGGGKGGASGSAMTKADFRGRFCTWMPPYHYFASGAAAAELKYGTNGCCKYEDRGYREAMEVLRQWDLTINPIYAQDQTKAAQLRTQIDKIMAEIKAGPTKITFKPGALLPPAYSACLKQQIALTKAKGGNPTKCAPLLKPKTPSMLFKLPKVMPKSTVHPAVAVAGGAAAVALILAFL